MLASQQEYDSGGFAAHPRVVAQKPRYKDPYGRAEYNLSPLKI